MNAPLKPRKLQVIEIDRIRRDPQNPRRIFLELEELAETVREHGIVQPITVRPTADGEFMIVYGERRWRAAKLVGLPHLECIVRELTDEQALELMLIENGQRKDVHPIEEAHGFYTLCTKFGYTREQLAEKVGKSLSTINARLRLSSLTEESGKACFEGKISASVALLLARMPDAKLQNKALELLTKRDPYDDDAPVEPLSFRHAQDVLGRGFSRDLEHGGFDVKDATLVPGAGACTTCPHRTGNQRELFDQDPDESADVCTAPACFKQKQDANWERQRAAAEKRGLRVLTDKESKGAFGNDGHVKQGSGYVDLGAKTWETGAPKTWKSLLGKAGTSAAVVARDKEGKVHELVPEVTAKALLEKRHPELAAKEAPRRADDGKWERERQIKTRALALAVGDVVERVEAEGATDKMLRLLALGMVRDESFLDAGGEATCLRRGIELPDDDPLAAMRDTLERRLADMAGPELLGLCLELVCMADNWKHELLGEACRALGIDQKKHEKAAKAAVAAAEKAAKKGTKAA